MKLLVGFNKKPVILIILGREFMSKSVTADKIAEFIHQGMVFQNVLAITYKYVTLTVVGDTSRGDSMIPAFRVRSAPSERGLCDIDRV